MLSTKRSKLLAAALIFYLLILALSAWHCDDAWITFRTARNFWEGHGLRWNVAERVQAYTHPSWLLVSIGCYGLAGELYFSILFVSFGLALTTAWLLARAVPASPWGAIAVVGALSMSRAIVDYATSGLETVLLGALVVVFALQLRPRPGPRRVGLLALLGAGCVLTRPDAMLLVLPAIGWSLLRGAGTRRARLCWLAAGSAPLVLWEIFSVIYYGSLVPNTAYAKLNVDIPRLELYRQGLVYVVDLLARDPITPAILLAALVVAFRRGSAITRAAAIGPCAYVLYVVHIGGDFMSGRFFVAPTLMALAAALVAIDERPISWPVALTARRIRPALLAVPLAVYALAWPGSPWRATPDYGEGWTREQIYVRGEIADERAFYYPKTGLLPVLARYTATVDAGLPIPPFETAIWGREVAKSGQRVIVEPMVGFFAYFAGPNVYVIDPFALGDPLLARIPYRPTGEWAIGHFRRAIPAGYRETRETGVVQLEDPRLASFYVDLQEVVAGPIWSWRRFRLVARLVTGDYGALSPDDS